MLRPHIPEVGHLLVQKGFELGRDFSINADGYLITQHREVLEIYRAFLYEQSREGR